MIYLAGDCIRETVGASWLFLSSIMMMEIAYKRQLGHYGFFCQILWWWRLHTRDCRGIMAFSVKYYDDGYCIQETVGALWLFLSSIMMIEIAYKRQSGHYGFFCQVLWQSVCFRPPCWRSGKASASRAEDPGFESRLWRDFLGVESYQWLKNGHSSGYPARHLAL